MTTWVSGQRTGRESVGTSVRLNGRDVVLNDVRPDGPASWCTSRYEVSFRALDAVPTAASASASDRRQVAEWVLAVWALESGYGANEWRWNAGGLHCVSTSRECMRLQSGRDPSREENLEAFPDAFTFAARWWAVVIRTTPEIVSLIIDDPNGAFRELYANGYGPVAAAAELPAVLRGVRSRLARNDRGGGSAGSGADDGGGSGTSADDPVRTRRRRGRSWAWLAGAAAVAYWWKGG